MINGIEGIPGSGKSYEAVVYHVLPALESGRLVVTNLPLVVDLFAAIDPAYRQLIELRFDPAPIRGTFDASRLTVDKSGRVEGNAFEIWPDGRSVAAPDRVVAFGHVWDYYHEWKGKKGQGPLFIIDECHDPLPVVGTDPDVVKWFKQHRHFNADVLLLTQSFRDIDQPIARLLAMLIKTRKADILGRAKNYIRKVNSGYRGATISTLERPYKPQYFGLYRSHTQGNSVAESAAQDVTPMLVWFMRSKWAVLAIAGAGMVYAFWPAKKPVRAPAPVASASSDAGKSPSPSSHAPARPVSSAVAQAPSDQPAQADDKEPEDPEPLKEKRLHLTGKLSMAGRTVYTFAVTTNGQRTGQLDSNDLAAMGYRWTAYTPCSGVARWKKSVYAVNCDAPTVPDATSNQPVVLAVPAGTTAPVASSVTGQITTPPRIGPSPI